MTIPIISQNVERALAFDVYGGGVRSFTVKLTFTNYLPQAYYFRVILKDENGNIVATQDLGQINPASSKTFTLSGSIDVTNKSHPVRTYWTIRIEAYMDEGYIQLFDYVETTIHVLYVSIPEDPYKYKCDYDGSVEDYCPTPDSYDSDVKIYGTASGRFNETYHAEAYPSGEIPVTSGKDIYLVFYIKGYSGKPTYVEDMNTGISLSDEGDSTWRLMALKLTPYQVDTTLVVKFRINTKLVPLGSIVHVDAIRIYEF